MWFSVPIVFTTSWVRSGLRRGALGWEGIYKFKSCLFLINSDMTTDTRHMQGLSRSNRPVYSQTKIGSKMLFDQLILTSCWTQPIINTGLWMEHKYITFINLSPSFMWDDNLAAWCKINESGAPGHLPVARLMMLILWFSHRYYVSYISLITRAMKLSRHLNHSFLSPKVRRW